MQKEKRSMVKKDFIGMFDALKGILMLLVIFAHHLHMMDVLAQSRNFHIAAEEILRYQIVPIALFFIITGYDFHPAKSLKTYIKRQARLLLIPYGVSVAAAALLSLAAGVLVGNFYYQRATVILAGGLYGCVRNMEILDVSAVSVIALWFLPTLFLGGLLLQLLYRIKQEKLRVTVIWFLVAAAAAAPNVNQLQLPWFIIQSCASLGFLETGRQLKKRKQLYQPLHPSFCIVAALLFLWGAIFSEANVGDNIYRFWLLDYLTGIAVSIVLLRLYVKIGFGEMDFRGIRFLEYFGRYSLYILCIHGVEMLAFPWYELGDLKDYGSMVILPIGIALYGGRLLLIAGICELLNRIIQYRRYGSR